MVLVFKLGRVGAWVVSFVAWRVKLFCWDLGPGSQLHPLACAMHVHSTPVCGWSDHSFLHGCFCFENEKDDNDEWTGHLMRELRWRTR